jgi:nucleoid DNA-binding protein
MGSEVSLRGLGTFIPVKRKPKQARNMKTGEAMTIPSCLAVKFTFAHGLKSL